jgi:type IV fimbrial biogenesis protein FimT
MSPDYKPAKQPPRPGTGYTVVLEGSTHFAQRSMEGNPMNQKGLSLTELVVTLAMVSTLAGLALPAYQPLIDRQHAQVAANELASALRSARTEAILRNQTVLIHPLDNNWKYGWRMLVDISGHGAEDSDNPVLVVRQSGGKVPIVGNTRVRERVRFNGLGSPSYAGSAPGNGTLFICDVREPVTRLRVVLSNTGRVRIDSGPGDTELCRSDQRTNT